MFGDVALHEILPPFAFQDEPSRGNNGLDSLQRASRRAGDVVLSSGFLDSLLRCRCDGPDSAAALRGGPTNVVFVSSIVDWGLQFDNLVWIKALVESYMKKTQTSAQKASSILRQVADEEGTTLLSIALSLGCSPDVIEFIVSRGAPVRAAHILKTARTDQPGSLDVLLRHVTYSEDMLRSDYSPSVLEVFASAKARQESLDKKMREEAGTFMIQVLHRTIAFGLAACHRRGAPRVELCSRVISEILVGNVLLRSLQDIQVGESAPLLDADDEDGSVGSGRAGHSFADGLLGCLPRDLLSQAFLSEPQELTTLLCLLEDYLCCKDMAEGSAGLMLLSSLLKTFPELRASKELQRYGMDDLVSFHVKLASSRMNRILPTLSGSATASAESFSKRAVTCPNGHAAVIHITRHSSFRCDICGCGVDRGCPMHGCRECDWDACEVCTDKSQSGFVKSSVVKALGVECLQLLSDKTSFESLSEDDENLVSKLRLSDNSSELESLASRLDRRDLTSIDELGQSLLSPGQVTVHQFRSVILPALFNALVGRRPIDSNDASPHLTPISGRRSKKARVNGDGDDTPEERLLFCKKAIRLFVGGSEPAPAYAATAAAARGDDEGENVPLEDSTSSSSASTIVKYSDAVQELLRRLQQLLSLHENVNLVSDLFGDRATKRDQSDVDLHSLKKPIEIELSPTCVASTTSQNASSSPLVIHSEPLVKIDELQLHVLRAGQISDEVYAKFCKR
jgi:hypothetical protein